MENPREHPLKVDLQGAGGPGDDAIIALSPEQNEVVRPDDLVISFSLLHADSTVDKSSVKTYLDGADISSSNVITGNLVIVTPPSPLSSGHHVMRVELRNKAGELKNSSSCEFTVRGKAPFVSSQQPPSTWVYTSSLQAETRNENISNSTTPYNRLSLSAGGVYN